MEHIDNLIRKLKPSEKDYLKNKMTEKNKLPINFTKWGIRGGIGTIVLSVATAFVYNFDTISMYYQASVIEDRWAAEEEATYKKEEEKQQQEIKERKQFKIEKKQRLKAELDKLQKELPMRMDTSCSGVVGTYELIGAYQLVTGKDNMKVDGSIDGLIKMTEEEIILRNDWKVNVQVVKGFEGIVIEPGEEIRTYDFKISLEKAQIFVEKLPYFQCNKAEISLE